MSSSNSNSENDSYETDDSDWNYIPGPYEIKKSSGATANVEATDDDEPDLAPYGNEPVASNTS